MSTANNTSEILHKLRQIEGLVGDCISSLEGQPTRRSKRMPARPAPSQKPSPPKLDFQANERAFMKEHARGLSGGRKFALLLAFLTKGNFKNEIQLSAIEGAWNRMTGLLGGFNRKYSNDAKEAGWVNTKKQGVYALRPSWQDIFK